MPPPRTKNKNFRGRDSEGNDIPKRSSPSFPVNSSSGSSKSTPFTSSVVTPESSSPTSQSTKGSQSSSQSQSKKATVPELPEYEWRSRGATLYYLQTVEETDTMLRRLSDKLKHNKEQGSSVIGFDLEWRPNYKPGRKENPVALVQLATEDEVFLVQVHWMKSIPASLTELLRDRDIIKVGVNILGDAEKLFTDYGITVSSCLELSHLARLVDNIFWASHGAWGKPSIGMARLCRTYLGRDLPKGKVRTSNWEAVLSQAQQDYAANDAHAGLSLYKTLVTKFAENPVALPDAIYGGVSSLSPDELRQRITSECAFNVVYKRALHPVTGLSWAPKPPLPFVLAYEEWAEKRRIEIEEARAKREAEKAAKAAAEKAASKEPEKATSNSAQQGASDAGLSNGLSSFTSQVSSPPAGSPVPPVSTSNFRGNIAHGAATRGRRPRRSRPQKPLCEQARPLL